MLRNKNLIKGSILAHGASTQSHRIDGELAFTFLEQKCKLCTQITPHSLVNAACHSRHAATSGITIHSSTLLLWCDMQLHGDIRKKTALSVLQIKRFGQCISPRKALPSASKELPTIDATNRIHLPGCLCSKSSLVHSRTLAE